MFDKTADRRLDVLRAIVSDYVETQEPVGSKSLVERYSLGVSAATIRNDMAALEEEGLIRQPHTSAGRVPTDKGYRFFVDQIDQIKPLSAPERQAITEFFSAAVGLDDVMERTVRLLAHLTRQTAVIEFPAFKQSTLRHLELVGMGAEPIRRVLAVVIASSGRVDQVLVNLPCGT
ncbi:putative heat-inducible transcription repressor HrcA, partial [Mobiluncus mulieris FB024-16]